MTLEAKYTIQVLAALINNTTTPMPPAQIDWKVFFDFAFKHKVENMMYAALSGFEDKIPADIMGMLAQRYSFGIAHEAAQEISFEELVAKFEEEGIKNIPLKGCILKYLYPMPDYRQSGDIDILVAPEDLKKVASVMEELGYTEDEFDEFEIHYGYRRPPGILIEIHKKLTEDELRTNEYFSKVWENVTLKQGFRAQYEFDKETMYTYIVTHMAKHIRFGGAGIRLVLDVWILLKLWEKEFDTEKLRNCIEQANLTDFEKWVRALAWKWFGNIDSDDANVQALGDYVIDSGIYGNKETGKKLKTSEVVGSSKQELKYKIKKMFKSTFLPIHSMRGDYPILLKYKFLLPVMWVHRIFKLLFDKELKAGERIKKSIEVKEGAEALKEIWEAVR